MTFLESGFLRTTCFAESKTLKSTIKIIKKYFSFIGPGLMVSVAYMDPGNYSTDVSAGANNKYSLLFIILLSNMIAIFLQTLCIKLGSVTGMDLARCCNRFLPKWLNYSVWVFAEIAIIATDVAEVIGASIALNVLIKVPLPAGVALTCVDILIVLMAYRPGASIHFVKIFELLVACLVFVVCICFCVQLAMIHEENWGQVFRGYIPSGQMFKNGGMYTAASILGATVMPHSLFLGSGLVQPRLRDFDIKKGYLEVCDNKESMEEKYYDYKPSLMAINYSLRYSIVELALTLFTFALFVNSAILIVAGKTLYGAPGADDADLFTIHSLLQSTLSPVFGTLFMVALLFSGQSAGIVCTIAGQIVSEGHINWTLKPWLRRVITRGISIIPCFVISISIGRTGLSKALDASQVVLSILLPFLIAPLIYFTCNRKLMKVEIDGNAQTNDGDDHDIEKINDFSSTTIITDEQSTSENLDIIHNSSVKRASQFLAQNIAGSPDSTCLPNKAAQASSRVDSASESREIQPENPTEPTADVNEWEFSEDGKRYKDMSNNWITSIVAIVIWIFISVLNVYAIVDLGINGLN